jgi:light-regulated signal transduction histidine kinase (bacteriophytochrome)
VVPDSGTSELDMFVEKICRGEHIESYETVRKTKDGSYISVSITLSPLRDAHGNIIGVSTIVRDITERKRMDAELAAHREHLEELVEQRTQELTRANNQLRTITQDLQRSNRDLEQFAYIASHDLQEPLRQIVAFTQFLNERIQDKIDDSSQELMDFIVEGGHRMQALIHDLLAFSRAGRSEHPPEPASLEVIFGDVMKNLKTSIEQADAVVTHDPLPTLKVDASQIGQVFQNLLVNALKFRGSQRPEIHVGAERKDGYWEFCVRDNGIGFKQQFAERIFNLFQRLQSHKDFPGTGIGLPICKRVVERHGGKIWAESEPGKGATFYFTLPAE